METESRDTIVEGSVGCDVGDDGVGDAEAIVEVDTLGIAAGNGSGVASVKQVVEVGDDSHETEFDYGVDSEAYMATVHTLDYYH